MKRIFLVAVVLATAGCETNLDYARHGIQYFKEDRTGFCFGLFMVNRGGGVVKVPCDSVAQYLVPPPR